MTCQQSRELQHGYLDGELDLLSSMAIERHFDECETCAKQHQKQLALRSVIREKAPYFDAPDVLKKRVTKSLAKADRTRSEFSFLTQRWLPIAAGVAILILSGALIWGILS